MKLPLHIAQKLQQLIQPGTLIPGSLMLHNVVGKMLEDGILQRKQLSKSKSQIYLPNATALNDYLHNQFGIGDIDLYVEKQSGEEQSRAFAVQISGNSKLNTVRTFSGFLANVYEPLPCTMRGSAFMLHPLQGSFTFIHDYKNFLPHPSVTIVGIENAENFTQIAKQQYLFKNIRPLFVSRYPQSNDLVKWLRAIPNPYLHFGDLDFEGINIYRNEFKKYLGERSSFFIPPQTGEYLVKFGNRALYNKQLSRAGAISSITETGILQLMEWIYQHKKVLEQEIFISEGDK
ncbi:MAG: hypothetical protein ABIS01_14080 [Ferruginibacter sp.]